MTGSRGSDALIGGRGDDRLQGRTANDFLYGERGTDTIVGGRGGDILSGGPGSDVFVFGENDGSDRILDYQPGPTPCCSEPASALRTSTTSRSPPGLAPSTSASQTQQY